MTIIIIILISIITTLTLSWHFMQLLINKHKNFPPSPSSLPIIGHLHLLHDPIHETLSKISKRVGPVFLLRLGRQRMVHISSSLAAEDCLRHNDVICADRPNILTGHIFGYGCTSIVWCPYNNAWRNYRRISNVQILSQNPLQLSLGIRSDEVKSLIRRVIKESKNIEIVDIGKALFDLTHDVIMRVLSNERYEGDELIKFRKVMREIMGVEGISTVVDLFPWVGVLGFKERFIRKFMVLAQEKDNMISKLVERNKRKMEDKEIEILSKEKKSFIEVLLSLKKTEPEVYTDDMIKGFFQVLLLAGSDTTAITIEWALTLLLNNPNILNKVRDEIDLLVGHDRLVNESDLTNLPYLRCIIYETLRLYPPAPMLLPHVSSDKCIIGGYTVPCGTTIFINVWAIQHDPTNWDEPETFKPERFDGLLEDGGEQLKYKFMPFGSGRRGCPGEGMAMRVAGLALASLIQCFEWGRPSPELIDMQIKPGFSIPKAQSLRANCCPNKTMSQILSQI